MSDIASFQALSPCTLADALTRDHVMDYRIRPLWEGIPRVAGPAFTVRCAAGDNLMLHAAIYRAQPGSIIVVESANCDYAVAGGNVCAVAQKRGIAAFVIDGVIRDVAEIRERRFPVFARGLSPIPGGKEILTELGATVRCGGIEVTLGSIVVADEEGIVVVPQAKKDAVLMAALARAAKDSSTPLEQWESAHWAKIEEILRKKGFADS
jgi:4-hydroxy-4-methyl-2-oxoglutarate aldolase